jgi:hypothetical protein
MQQISVEKLQSAFHSATFGRYEILLPNIHYLHNEMDLFGFRKNSGYSDEIEIKLSKSDYLADFKKTTSVKDGGPIEFSHRTYYKHKRISKHDAIKQGLYPCNYFAYLLPEELSEKCDIPSYAGLYIYSENRHGRGFIQEKIKAPRLHKRKLDFEIKYQIAKKATYKVWSFIEGRI